MKSCFKRALSVFLSLTIIFTISALAFPSASASSTLTDIPVIYVEGQGAALGIRQEDGSYKQVYDIVIPDGYIENVVKENIDVFLLAVLTQDWDDFCDVIYNEVTPFFDEIKLDENAQAPNGSEVIRHWSREPINTNTVDGKYELQQFIYRYDWRMDPLKTADDLHSYIEAVMTATGHEKVALVGRCLGTCVTMAYMEKYDGEYITDHIMYCSALEGVTFCSKAFCGEIYLDADGVERFVYDMQLFPEEYLDTLLKSFVTVANDTYGLDLALWSVNNVYPNIYLDIVPRLLRDTFGTFPGYWAMVRDEDYEKAKEVIFYGAEEGKYDNFISIIDNYHYTVQTQAREIAAEQDAAGIEYYNISKYGRANVPISDDNENISDSYVELSECSMGATVTTVNTVFSDDYIAAAEAGGTLKYISADKQVDASTCVFPNQTWFVKNIEHQNFPHSINLLMTEMVNVDGFSVDSNESFPQFLVYNEEDGSIKPMTSENENTTSRWNVSFWDALRKLFESLLELIKNSMVQN